MIIVTKESSDYKLKKGTLALIMVIIALLSCVVTVVAYGVTMQSDIDNLKEMIDDANIDERINACEKRTLSNQVLIQEMHDDIKEIKVDIKGLIAR